MVKSSIQVYVRTRPTAEFAHNAFKLDTIAGTVGIHMDRNSTGSNLLQDWTFRFNRVLHNESQETTFDVCCHDMVESAMSGYNGTLMAYGQTGAGKSFTMGNGTFDYKYRGIAPRAISQIFRAIAAKPETEVLVRVSYLEIYNESLRDLLCVSSRDMSVREDGCGNVSVKGLRRVEVSSEEQALNMLFEGDSNRAIGEHSNNSSSSRSHTVFTIYLESRSRVESAEKVALSKLNLVDLAGSERVAKTDSRGQTLQEALYINRSLSFLEQVVIALSTKHRDHVPFRSSKLTHVLRDSLGGNSITRLIANIWPEARHLEETISTLKFATRMMRLTTDATINIDLDPTLLLKKYEKQIIMLKQELSMHDMISNRGSVSYEDFTPEQQKDLKTQIDKFIKSEIPQLEIINLQQVHELFRQFKILCLSYGAGSNQSRHPTTNCSETNTLRAPSEMTKIIPSDIHHVGDMIENVGGFSVGGDALPDARPIASDDMVDAQSRTASPDRHSALTPTPIVSSACASMTPSSTNGQLLTLPEDDKNFQMWRKSIGSALSTEYGAVSVQLRSARSDLKSSSQDVNHLKRSIDSLTSSLGNIRQGRAKISDTDVNEIIDEEEYALIRDLKHEKVEYQKAFERWNSHRSQVVHLKSNVQHMKGRLASEFLHWCEDQRRQAGIESDILDDGEQFDKIETDRIMNTDPESLSYYNARKTLMRNSIKNKRSKRTVDMTGR